MPETPDAKDVSKILSEVKADEPGPSSKPSSKSSSTYKGRTAPTLKQIEERLTELVAMAAVFTTYRNEYDGMVVAAKAPDVVTNLMRLAQENPRIKKLLDTLVLGSTYAELVASLGAVAIPIMVNHNMLPVDPQITTFFGVEAPIPKTEVSGNGNLSAVRMGTAQNDDTPDTSDS